MLTCLRCDALAGEYLAGRGRTLATVPVADDPVLLRATANRSTGGIPVPAPTCCTPTT